MKMSTMARKIATAASLCGSLLLLGACAGDRHLGPGGRPAFDTIITRQAVQREDELVDQDEMTAEDAEVAVTNVRQISQRGSTTSAAPVAPLLPVQR
jgi:hypothetical protein